MERNGYHACTSHTLAPSFMEIFEIGAGFKNAKEFRGAFTKATSAANYCRARVVTYHVKTESVLILESSEFISTSNKQLYGFPHSPWDSLHPYPQKRQHEDTVHSLSHYQKA